LLAGKNDALQLISFPAGKRARTPEAEWICDQSKFGQAKSELGRYFAGQLKAFSFAVDPAGTEFQLAVWAALRRIPYGRTTTYGDLARAIGRPKAVRAVGAANGANPLPIVIPCHRVIGADGTLTGFGGGIDSKRDLLKLEGAWPAAAAQTDLFDPQ